MTDDEPQTIRESGDPNQGAPNKHVTQAEWEALKTDAARIDRLQRENAKESFTRLADVYIDAAKG